MIYFYIFIFLILVVGLIVLLQFVWARVINKIPKFKVSNQLKKIHSRSQLTELTDAHTQRKAKFSEKVHHQDPTKKDEIIKILSIATQTKRLKTEFYSSEDFNLIRQFTRKFKNNTDESEILKLQSLLNKRNRYFSIEELKDFIKNETNREMDKSLSERVFINNPKTFRKAVFLFLESFNPEDTNILERFIRLSKNKRFRELNNLENEKLFSFVETEIINVEEEIELTNFEKSLSDETEIISLEDIDQFDGYEFEDFLKHLFPKMGYRVKQTKLSGDQGADLVVVKLGIRTVIQAKRSVKKVGNKAVQEIMAAISIYKAQKGMVITNSYYTTSAYELANANNIELVDRDGLEKMINNHW